MRYDDLSPTKHQYICTITLAGPSQLQHVPKPGPNGYSPSRNIAKPKYPCNKRNKQN
ncbi:hypothetical protein Hanom_Chr16g01492681 [Helianthus anomalus]